VGKIIAQAAGKNRRIRSNGNVEGLAKEIKQRLISVFRNPENEEIYEETIGFICEFNRKCHRVKGRKVTAKNDSDQEEGDAPTEEDVEAADGIGKEINETTYAQLS
jgi:hypothetical protein